ncbi:PREDICTED: uncharacterized protein LOC108548801 [Eufriesea mexicana]|uniref:uncharacterized protein LOC108548801 n=1 Tax=Eufriesea mexicana TaxID=516756 RepID=UPI00083C0A73|nr:PREDICTED: uncharacterized protein LOC108548801 [Eufriesea mexicana]
MNKIGKTLIKNSIVNRNWTFLSNLSTLSNHDNSIIKKSMENNNIVNSNIENILKNIEQNYKNMNVKTAVNIMDCLYNEHDKRKELHLVYFTEFEYICKVLLKDIRSLSTYDTIKVLRNLLTLNVPPNTVIIQTLLQLIRVSINKLTIKQIMRLYYMLYNVQKSPLIESLLLALPHVLEQQAQIELDSTSTNLMEVLQFCIMTKNLETQRYVISLLFKNKQNIKLPHAINIFGVICNLPELCPVSKQLLFYIQKIIERDYKKLNISETNWLLLNISKKCMNLKTEFYCKVLIDKLCFNILSYHTSPKDDLHTIIYLNNMHHSNILLLEKLVEKYLKDTDTLKMCSIHQVHHFIKGFVIADYRPHNWETIGRMLQNFIINIDYPICYIVSTVYYLLSLNCYCPKLIEKAFILHNNVTVTIKEHILKLYWCIKLLYPEYNGIMPDETKLNQIKIKHKGNNVSDLMKSLVEVIGDARYIKSGLKTKFGTFVDHVVVIQPDGFLMNTSSYGNIIFVEELVSLTEGSKFLFFAFPVEAYSINEKCMLSTVKMELKALETLSGFHTVVINPYLWNNLVDKEKILHLHKIMRSKSSNICYK